MIEIGFLDIVLGRNKELEYMFDADLIENTSNRIYMKKLALQTCIDYVARTISQSEFRVRKNKRTVKDEMYYRLNVMPNQNQSAVQFWQNVIQKLVYDNECLIIQADTQDLLVADSFLKIEYAVYEDSFKDVIVKNYAFKRVFKRHEVIYLEYSNERLERIINGLFEDYGKLFGRMIEFQMRKNQIRGTVNIDSHGLQDEKRNQKINNFIQKTYKAIQEKAVAIVPQQKGYDYTEHSKNQGVSAGVDEVGKVYENFLETIAKAMGIPVNLLRGDIADIEQQTKNYMTFCIDPLVSKIASELNARLIDRDEYLAGHKLEIRRPTYKNLFDVATAADKLRSSGLADGHELRDALGLEESDDPIHDKFVMTKNYSESLEGGETDEEN